MTRSHSINNTGYYCWTPLLIIDVVDTILGSWHRILFFNDTFFINGLFYTVLSHTLKPGFARSKEKYKYRKKPGFLYMPFKARVACFSKINAGIQDLLDLSRLPWLTRLLLTVRSSLVKPWLIQYFNSQV